MEQYQKKTTEYLKLIDSHLFQYLPHLSGSQTYMSEAMSYSMRNGGKRARPVLTLAFCEMCGGTPYYAIAPACAVEMIHSYSLIHDDLPCMDNDDFRRGVPSLHKAFGEANALLAGDALLTLAFGVIAGAPDGQLTATQKARLISVLSTYAGVQGMVGGQFADLMGENIRLSLNELKSMDVLKTGALIRAACEMGAISAGAKESEISAAGMYGELLGLSFQIVDDLLDNSTEQTDSSVTLKSDLRNNKSTYVSLLGVQESRRLAQQYADEAISALDEFTGDTSFIKNLTKTLLVRKK